MARMGAANPLQADQARLKEVIREVLKHSDPLFAVEIQKTIFYGEIYCTEKYAGRLTDARFYPSMYGAYSADIREALDDLEDEVPTKLGKRLGRNKPKFEAPERGAEDSELRRIIGEICSKTQTLDLDELTELSRANWLFRNAEHDEIMSFEKYHRKIKNSEIDPLLIPKSPFSAEEQSESNRPDCLLPLDPYPNQ